MKETSAKHNPYTARLEAITHCIAELKGLDGEERTYRYVAKAINKLRDESFNSKSLSGRLYELFQHGLFASTGQKRLEELMTKHKLAVGKRQMPEGHAKRSK